MNLYKILFTHTAPKGRKEGIMTYLLAENEEQVYSFIDKEYNYECWKDKEEENETFKQKILRLKGEMNDDDYDYSDAYYGVTLYGWELVKEDLTSDYLEMISLNVFKNCL